MTDTPLPPLPLLQRWVTALQAEAEALYRDADRGDESAQAALDGVEEALAGCQRAVSDHGAYRPLRPGSFSDLMDQHVDGMALQLERDISQGIFGDGT